MYHSRLGIYLRTLGLPTSRLLEASVFKLVNRRSIHIPYAPLSIHFGATKRCNLNCLMCDRSSVEEAEDLSYERFCKMLNQIPRFTMRRISCEGLGEPLLNRDLIKMFSYAKRRGFITHTFTNATLLHKIDAVSLLKVLDEITISMDGATKETFEKIRRGAKFEHVVENVKMLVALRARERTPTYLTINFTCNKFNIHEISKMKILASQLGVDELQLGRLREQHPWKPVKEHKQLIEELHLDHPKESSFPYCNWPFRACYVSQEGFVTPCCIESDPDIINFGNIFQTPLAEIWNNQKYKKFRYAFITGQPPKPCTKCIS